MAYRQTRSRYTAGAVGVLIDDQQRLLLVEHVYHARFAWGFAGGWVNRMEEPAQAVVREFEEEMALEVRVIRPIWVQKSQYWGAHLDIAFLLEAQVQDIQLSAELLNYAWYHRAELPPLNPFNQCVVESLVQQGLIS